MKPKLLLTLALLLSAVTGAWAQNSCGDGLTWSLSGGTLTISKTGEGTGAMTNSDLQNVPWYNERNNITSVVIGDGVTAIGKYAFFYCSNLASLTIGSSLQTIGVQAFSGCSKLASVNLPASVTNIGDNAFDDCSNLSSVVIHATSVPTCGNDAFGKYKSGRKIFVPFAKVVDYKTGWSAYESNIFGYSNCGETGHESDVIYALTGTSPNYTLYIMKVGATGAMKNCDLENVPWYNERNNITSVVIGDGVTAIGQYAFYYCSNLASVTIGSSLQSIGVCAFYNCPKLASVNLPATMTSIGNNAFDNCSNLSSVVIHATSVPTCLSDAFKVNKAGRKIFVPAASVGSYGSGWSAYAADIIGYNGTCGATGHESDVVYALTGESPNRTLYISGTGAMKDNYKPWSDFTTVIIGDGVTHIGKQSFDYLSFTSLTIGNGVKSIGELAFHNCSGLTSIVIPNSVETIGEKAFEYITTLTSLTIGSGVTSMADNAFDYCENVTSLTISDGVTTIGKGAFEKYSSLTSVVIPSSVTSIGENAFKDCPQLSSVVIQATSVPTCGNDAFAGTAEGLKIYVPAGSVDTYKAAWSAYEDKIEAIPATYTVTANLANGAYWATFYSNAGNYQAPEGTRVFAVTLNTTTAEIMMTEISDRIVKSGEGVVLKKSTTGNIITMTLTATTPTGDFSGNSLQGTMTQINTTGANDYYVLNYKESIGVGFYKLSNTSGAIDANKAYLTTAASALAREFFLFDEATGIESIDHSPLTIDHSVYDLQGRRVAQPTKGLYIVNGKKVFINK